MPDQYCAAGDADAAVAVVVVTFPMPAGLVFDWHTHRDHQLAWAASGVLTVRTQASAWVLPPTRALWIPAGLPHETLSAGAATMRSAYVRPDRYPLGWTEPTAVSASPLLCELIGYLEDRTLAADRRERAEGVLVDLLQPVAMTTVDVRWPADDRARQVADRLAASPADGRTLAEWGHEVGASERTLARAFVAETGVSFGRWPQWQPFVRPGFGGPAGPVHGRLSRRSARSCSKSSARAGGGWIRPMRRPSSATSARTRGSASTRIPKARATGLMS